MPSYHIYIPSSEKELIETMNDLKDKGLLSDFVVESCSINLDFFLQRQMGKAKADLKYWKEVTESINKQRERFQTEKENRRREFLIELSRVPQGVTLGLLTAPVWIKKWKRSGFGSAEEVLEAYNIMIDNES